LSQSHCKCGNTQSSAAHKSADSKLAALLLKLLKNNPVTGWYCAREPNPVIDSMNNNLWILHCMTHMETQKARQTSRLINVQVLRTQKNLIFNKIGLFNPVLMGISLLSLLSNNQKLACQGET
jgi:hypothetical protein